MAQKKSTTNTNKETKKTAPKNASKKVESKDSKNSKATSQSDRKTVSQRFQDIRDDRKERKAASKRRKQTEKARAEKAKKLAVQEKAVEQVNRAVENSKKRKSRPLLTLLISLILVGLGAAAMYQYRQFAIDERNLQVTKLEAEIKLFSAEKQAIEADKAAEEARFSDIKVGEAASMRLPQDWKVIPSAYPLEETVVGNENVTITVVNSQSRNSKETFIPSVDNLWIMTSSTSVEIVSQSRHCNRFDTFNNDFSDTRREHQGFTVYCDSNPEVLSIAVLRAPEAYGLETTGDYFLIQIKDVQQVSLEDIKEFVESYK